MLIQLATSRLIHFVSTVTALSDVADEFSDPGEPYNDYASQPRAHAQYMAYHSPQELLNPYAQEPDAYEMAEREEMDQDPDADIDDTHDREHAHALGDGDGLSTVDSGIDVSGHHGKCTPL